MKFFICAVVLCVFSISCQAIVVPLGVNVPLLYSAAYGPRYVTDNSHSIVVNGPSTLPAEITHLFRAPLLVPVGLNTEGTYIAKTLGSEHIAPLPGHLSSASSINLEQAPGSKDSSSLLPSSVAIHQSAFPRALPLSFTPLVVSAPLVAPSEATYIAKNIGVEHIAPLPGHTISATSLNLQPAPGSK